MKRHEKWQHIKVAWWEWERAKREASELGMTQGQYWCQVMRNHWQDPRPLKILPAPVVNPWQPKQRAQDESSGPGPTPN